MLKVLTNGLFFDLKNNRTKNMGYINSNVIFFYINIYDKKLYLLNLSSTNIYVSLI